jgi:hypothetical protein
MQSVQGRFAVARLSAAATRCEPTGSGCSFQIWPTSSKNDGVIPKTADSFQNRLTPEKSGRLWKKAADSGKKQLALEKNSRLWKETADSGNGGCVCFPDGMSRPRFSRRFETRRAVSVGGDMN